MDRNNVIQAKLGFNASVHPVFIDVDVIAYIQGRNQLILHQIQRRSNHCFNRILPWMLPAACEKGFEHGDIRYLASDPKHKLLAIGTYEKVIIYRWSFEDGYQLQNLHVLNMQHCLAISCENEIVVCMDCENNGYNEKKSVNIVTWSSSTNEVGKIHLSFPISNNDLIMPKDILLTVGSSAYFIAHQSQIVRCEISTVETSKDQWSFSARSINVSAFQTGEVITSCTIIRGIDSQLDIICLGTSMGNIIQIFEDGEKLLATFEVDRDEIKTMSSLQGISGFLAGTTSGCIQMYVALENDSTKYCCCKRWMIEEEDESSISYLSSSCLQNVFLTVSAEANHLYWIVYDVNNSLLRGISSDGIVPRQLKLRNNCIVQGHRGEIFGVDTSITRPIVASIGSDQTLRLWDYTLNAPLIYKKYPDRFSHAIAIHPNGLYLVVGFQDKVMIHGILVDDVVINCSIPVKNSFIARFSHGGHQLAIANNSNISIYDPYSMAKLVELCGHIGIVFHVSWTPDDSLISTIGKEGAIYMWSTTTYTRIGETSCTRNPTSCATDTNGVSWIVEDGGKTLLSAKLPDTILHSDAVNEGFQYGSLNRYSNGIILSCHRINEPVCHLQCRRGDDTKTILTHYESISHLCITDDQKVLLFIDKAGIVTVVSMEKVDPSFVFQRFPTERSSLISAVSLKTMNDTNKMLSEKINELNIQNEYQERLKLKLRKDKIKEITESYDLAIEQLLTSQAILREEITNMVARHDQTMKLNRKSFRQIENDRSCEMQLALADMVQEYDEILQDAQNSERSREQERCQLLTSHQNYCSKLKEKFSDELSMLVKNTKIVEDENTNLSLEFDEILSQVENDIFTEVELMTERYNTLLDREKENSLKHNSRIGLMSMKVTALSQEISEKKEKIKSMLEVEESLYEEISKVKSDLKNIQSDIENQNEDISQKKLQLHSLQVKTKQLETCKIVLQSKIDKLKDQIEPQEKKVASLSCSLNVKHQEIEGVKSSNLDDNSELLKIKGDTTIIQQRIKERHGIIHSQDAYVRSILSHLHEYVQLIQIPNELRSKIKEVKLSRPYHSCNKEEAETLNCSSKTLHNQNPTSVQLEEEKSILMAQISKVQSDLALTSKANKARQEQIIQENMSLLSQINSINERKKTSKRVL